MMSCRTARRGARFSGAALLALAVLASGCGRPPDTAWLRFLGFTDTTSTSLMVLEGGLRDGKALTANANFENRSLNVDQKAGTGILVYRVRIDYRMDGHSPPAAEYDFNLYLPPPAESTPTKGTIATPLAPISLKQWLIDTGAFEDKSEIPVVELTAQLTFYGETDEGTKLEIKGSIGIALSNTATTSPSTKMGTTSPSGTTMVNVVWKADASISGADRGGAMTRSSGIAASLTVSCTTTGSTAVSGGDCEAFGTVTLKIVA